jgi:DNA-binding NtrC family response regulator
VAIKTTVTAIVASDGDRLSLVVVGDGVLQSSPLPDVGRVTIGRSAECEIRIDDASISRNHATIIVDPLSVIDNGSANGTWVDNQRIPANSPVAIRLHQNLRLGSVAVIVQRNAFAPQRARKVRSHTYFESRLDDECDLAAARGNSLAVVHVVAPGAIDLVDTIGAALQDADVVASYGPDELELLLVGTTPDQAHDVVRRIEGTLVARGHDARLGSAWYPRDGRDPSALAGRARRRALGDVDDPADAGDIVVVDPRMAALHELIARVARADISVLLNGETGVGKEVVAEAIHRQSQRAGGPFVKLNCAALSDTLLESELFGHERGAFTGAIAVKQGLLEVAEGGVVFLDEVGELSLATQAKLLRVLDARELMRVGGLAPRPIDVRIVSATNRHLEAEVNRGTFRLDLLYRLNAMSIAIPPLRERTLEIVPLARRFLHGIAAKLDRPTPRLTEEAEQLLVEYAWPGNVRELRNVIERAMVLATGNVIEARDLPEDRMRPAFAAAAPAELRPTAETAAAAAHEAPIASDERQQILDALEACHGNQTHAAKLLGVSRRTLINKLEKFAMPRPRKRT